MMATRGKRALALFVTCIMVLGMLPAAALAADGEAHVHGQAGWVGETYYTGVCEYTEGETVKSETPDLCDGAINAHAHTDACTAEEEEAAVCTGELNAHEHTDACYSVTQTEGAWTCETGEPPVEEPEEEEPVAEETTEEQMVTMGAEPMTYTISGAEAYVLLDERGAIPAFSFEGTPGTTINPADLPAGPVLYQYNGNDWYYIYTGKVMGTGWLVGYTATGFTLGKDNTITANMELDWGLGTSYDTTTDMSSLRFFYEYAFAFPDLGSEGVTVMYSIDGGPLTKIQTEPLIFSQDEVKEIGTIAFFVKAEQGYYPVDSFSQTTGDQKGILSRLDDPQSTLGSAFDGIKADALAEGFTHEFHYSEFKDGEFSDQGVRGYKLKGEADTNEYTITYHANAPMGVQASGKTDAQSGTWNTRFDIAENGFTVSGYEFQGWNTAADGSGESYAPGYGYTIMGKDLDLYAQWKARAAKFFIRTDGTIPMEDGKVGYNASKYLPANSTDSSSAAYQKLLWGQVYGKKVWTDYQGVIVDGKINGVKLSEAFASVSAEIAAAPTDEQLKAMGKLGYDPETQAVAWYVIKSANADSYLHVDGVIYDKGADCVLQYFPNAGDDEVTGLPGSKLYVEGVEAPVSYGSMTREGYDFLGWSENADATEPTYTKGGDLQTISMNGDQYLYAVWQKTPAPVKYTVTVNFLVEGTGDKLMSYVSDSMTSGTAYDVKQEIEKRVTITVGSDTYHYYRTSGEAAGNIQDSNVVVNAYYQADQRYTAEYYLETGHGTGSFELDQTLSKWGMLFWNSKPVTSQDHILTLEGYTYDESNPGNVKQVAYGDEARTLKLYYKMNAPVDPGHYTVIYTDGTGLEGAEHNKSFTKAVGETYAPFTDNNTTGFAKDGHDFASWQLREGSVVHGESDKLYGDKGSTIYYDAQWTAGQYPITVTKTASGQSLPANFSMAVTDKDGQAVETLTLDQATLANGTYTWTTKDLTFDQTYTFTEQNYAVSGYNLAASIQVLTGTDANGNVYQTTNGVAASMTLNHMAQTTGTAVALTNSYSQTQTGGDPGPGPDYSYYRVTVRYLDRADGKELAEVYRTDRIREGRTYDVTGNIPSALTADGVEYSHSSTEGAAAGTIRGNVTVTAWYTAEPDEGGTTDIPDGDVPQGDKPVTPPAGQPDGTVPDGGDEIDIEDGDVPQGGLPTGVDETTGGGAADQTDGGDGTVILDGDTPMGNLPQTGTLAQQADPTRTLGMLALALSLAAAGLAVTIGRKKEDEA